MEHKMAFYPLFWMMKIYNSWTWLWTKVGYLQTIHWCSQYRPDERPPLGLERLETVWNCFIYIWWPDLNIYLKLVRRNNHHLCLRSLKVAKSFSDLAGVLGFMRWRLTDWKRPVERGPLTSLDVFSRSITLYCSGRDEFWTHWPLDSYPPLIHFSFPEPPEPSLL